MYKLIELNSIINKQVDEFLRDYLWNTERNRFLRDNLGVFLKKCRYTHDDFRPLLTKFGFQLFAPDTKNDGKKILPAMASIDLLLLSVIPMDDAIDVSPYAVSNKTLNNESDNYALGYGLSTVLAEHSRMILHNYYADSNYFNKLSNLFSNTLIELNTSHFTESVIHRQMPINEYTIDDYFQIVDIATSSLIAFSFVSGGMISSNIDMEIEKKMWKVGIQLGRLRQIYDDILDLVVPEIYNTGKLMPFSDIRKKKKRFPLLVCYWAGNTETKDFIENLIERTGEITDNDILRLINTFCKNDLRAYAENIISQMILSINKDLDEMREAVDLRDYESYDYLRQIINRGFNNIK